MSRRGVISSTMTHLPSMNVQSRVPKLVEKKEAENTIVIQKAIAPCLHPLTQSEVTSDNLPAFACTMKLTQQLMEKINRGGKNSILIYVLSIEKH